MKKRPARKLAARVKSTPARKTAARAPVVRARAGSAPSVMTRDALRAVAADLSAAKRRRGKFLSFVMIPVEERIGEWRFAGRATNLADALGRLRDLCHAMQMPDVRGVAGFLADMADMDVLQFGKEIEAFRGRKPLTFAACWEADELPAHHVVLLVEGGAPHDDFGLAVIEVTDYGGFARMAPQTEWPESWPDE